MNYEQKYKKLVDAIKVMRDVNPSDEGLQNWISDNVPELAESEDERIRESAIKLLRRIDSAVKWSQDGYTLGDIIAWLEKKGKETSWKPSKEEMDVLYGLAYITNQYDERKEEVITCLYQDLKREFFNGSSYENMFPANTSTEDDVRRRSTIQVLEYARSLDTYNQFGKADIDKNIAWLEKQGEPVDKGEISDGFHTFNELYYYRMLYNAAFFNMLPKEWVHKSKKHNDGEECFGGGWFIVMANLPTGQISNHYELKDWDLFQIPEKERADKWDGHIPQEAAERLHNFLLEKQGNQPQGKSALEAINEEKFDNANKVEPKDYNSIDPHFAKPVDKVESKFKVGDKVTDGNLVCEIESIDEECYYCDYTNFDIKDQDKWMLAEQKSDDKVEPKFHEGDWICTEIRLLNISSIENGMYYFDEGDEMSIEFVDKYYHMWTIHDAKDGEVIVAPKIDGSEYSEQIFIFKEINNRDYVKNAVEYYCRVVDNKFYVNKQGYMGQSDECFVPATKEQRDTLMKAMADAGYEWDAEKKELNKIGTKFKIGDWIVWQDKCYKVNYNGCGYELIDQNGLSTSLEYGTIDENAHIWTIADAKNGDILVVDSSDSIILFRGIKDNNIDFYCDYDFSEIDSEVDVTKDRFEVNERNHYGSVEDAEDIHPATKEQRDTLMKAMTNEGWQFDFEKKELKKNDQNSAWSEDDERLRKTSIAFLQEFAAKGYENAIECMDWLKSLKNKIINE